MGGRWRGQGYVYPNVKVVKVEFLNLGQQLTLLDLERLEGHSQGYTNLKGIGQIHADINFSKLNSLFSVNCSKQLRPVRVMTWPFVANVLRQRHLNMLISNAGESYPMKSILNGFGTLLTYGGLHQLYTRADI